MNELYKISNPLQIPVVPGSTVPAPSVGRSALFFDSENENKLSSKNSAGKIGMPSGQTRAVGVVWDSSSFDTIEADTGSNGSTGYWLMIFSQEGVSRGDVWYKTTGSGEGSFAKVMDYLDAPNTFTVETPAYLNSIAPNTTYLKYGNSWHAAGTFFASGIIEDSADFIVKRDTESPQYQGMWLVNFTEIVGSASVSEGDVWLKKPDNSFTRIHTQSDAPVGFTYNGSTYIKKYGEGWVEAGTGSGGGGGISLPTFTISDANGLVAGDIIEIDSNGEVKNIIQEIAGSGTGVSEINKPNLVPDPLPNNFQDLQFCLSADGQACIFNIEYQSYDIQLVIAENDGNSVNYGEIKTATDTGYSELANLSEEFCGAFAWNANTVTFFSDYGNDLWLAAFELSNNLQVNRMEKVKIQDSSLYPLTPTAYVKCQGDYLMWCMYHYDNSRYYIQYGRYTPFESFTIGGDIASSSSNERRFISMGYIGNYGTTSGYVALRSKQSGYFSVSTLKQAGETAPTLGQADISLYADNNYTPFILPHRKYIDDSADLYFFCFHKQYAANIMNLTLVKVVASTGQIFVSTVTNTVIPVPLFWTNYMLQCVVNNPSTNVFTFTVKVNNDTTGLPEFRMYVYILADDNSVTLVQQGGEDYVVLLNDSECSANTFLPKYCHKTVTEGNGYCYVPFYDALNARTGLIKVQMDGSTVINVSGWDGIAQESGLQGDEISVALRGMQSAVHTGLSAGSNMYLDSLGQIIADYTIHPIGQAISANTINLVTQMLTTPDNELGYQDKIMNSGMTNKLLTDYFGDIAVLADSNLKMTVGEFIRFFGTQTTDPQIVGAIWDNNGQLAISEGV